MDGRQLERRRGHDARRTAHVAQSDPFTGKVTLAAWAGTVVLCRQGGVRRETCDGRLPVAPDSFVPT
jgi:hypothetical protein